MAFELGTELLSAILGATMGYAIKYGYDKTHEIYIRGRLIKRAWEFLRNPTHIYLPLYNNPKEGAAGWYGDMLAMAHVMIIANKYFASSKSKTLEIHAAQSTAVSQIANDNLVVIGGGKNNHIYRHMVEILKVPIHFFDTEKKSYREIRNADRSILFSPKYDSNGALTHDIGLLVKACHPFKEDRWVVIGAGSHTYGSTAAIQYMIEPSNIQEIQKQLDKNFAVVVQAKIMNYSISEVERISKIYTW